jgi:hypothetical protein
MARRTGEKQKGRSLLDILRERAAAKKRQCVICQRADRVLIDAAYGEGKATGKWGINQIARELSLNWNTLKRHFTVCAQ